MKKLSYEDKREIMKSVIISLVGLFLIIYSAVPFYYFLSAPIKSTSEATLIDSKLNDAIGDGGLLNRKFVYKLKWEFEYKGKKYVCSTTEPSSDSSKHSIGEKKMIFAYSRDGKNFRKVKLGIRTVGLPLLGLACIIFVIWDLFSYRRFKNEDYNEKSLYTIMSNV